VLTKSASEPVHLVRTVKRLVNRPARKPPGSQKALQAAGHGHRPVEKIWTYWKRGALSWWFDFGVAALAAAAGAAAPAPRKGTPAAKASVSPKVSPTVHRWMKGMTLRDEVAQLIFIAFHGTAPHSRYPGSTASSWHRSGTRRWVD